MQRVEFIRYASRQGIPFLDMSEDELDDELCISAPPCKQALARANKARSLKCKVLSRYEIPRRFAPWRFAPTA